MGVVKEGFGGRFGWLSGRFRRSKGSRSLRDGFQMLPSWLQLRLRFITGEVADSEGAGRSWHLPTSGAIPDLVNKACS